MFVCFGFFFLLLINQERVALSIIIDASYPLNEVMCPKQAGRASVSDAI